jgi:hypothetical protein
MPGAVISTRCADGFSGCVRLSDNAYPALATVFSAQLFLDVLVDAGDQDTNAEA